jgi:acid phosphatase
MSRLVSRVGWAAALLGLTALLAGCDEQATTGPKLAPPSAATVNGTTAGHVVLVTEENTNFADVTSSSMPYLMGLAAQYGMATKYYANTHPSIGNYFELATGQVLTNDDGSSTIQTAGNIVRELLKAGKTWKSYAEDLPSVGYLGGDVGNYARKHNVFALLSDVANSSTQAQNLVPFSQFATDLKNGTLPNFSNVVPNLCNDAHDCSLGTADSWLKSNIAPLLASSTFQQDGVLIVTFDESGSDNTNGGGKVMWVVVSPQAKHGYVSTTLYQHPSTLRLILATLGVSTFPGAASNAPDMSEFFGTSITPPPPPPPPTGTCQTSALAWWGTALSAPQTGNFTAEFDATPSGSGVDGVIGLGPKIASGYTDMATIVRFNVNNQIDARNGGTYAAASSIPYTAGTSYHFRLVVSIGTHTYAAYVRPAGGTELTIGSGYAFRTEQASVTTLADWSMESDYSSTMTVCNMAITSGTPPPPPPTPAPVATVTLTPATASLTVGQTLQLTATEKDASGNLLTGRTVTWASSNAGSVSVTSGGLVTALAAGSATVTATSETVSGTAAISATAPVATTDCGSTGSGRCWYVATTGNDANAGTQSAPFKTLQRAANVVNPGDGVLVGAGVYTGSSSAVVTLSRSGTASAWITFKSAATWGAVVDGQNNYSQTGISIRANYVRVQGFEVRGSDRGGIDAYNGSSRPHDVDIVLNNIHDIGKECTGDSGGRVGVNAYADNLTIERNVIHDIGRFAAGENGCSPSNDYYKNHDHGVYAEEGTNVVIRNNVFYRDVRGWPIHRYSGSGIGLVGLFIIGNTFDSPNPWKVGQVIIGGPTTGLVISGNIFNNPTTAGVWLDAGDGGSWGGAIISNNLSTTAVVYGGSASGTGNLTGTSPQFVSSGDYHLASGSPAIDRGYVGGLLPNDYDGILRPVGAGNDIGAFERH